MKKFQDKIIDDILQTKKAILDYNTKSYISDKIDIKDVESIEVLKGEINKKIEQHNLKEEEFFDLSFDGQAFSILWKQKN